MSNKITTMGYFLKRLRDSGYYSHAIFTNYSESDSRSWSIVIDPGGSSVICTCYVNDPFVGDSCIELYDGGQYIPGRVKLITDSYEVVVEALVRYNINNKTQKYINKGTLSEKE